VAGLQIHACFGTKGRIPRQAHTWQLTMECGAQVTEVFDLHAARTTETCPSLCAGLCRSDSLRAGPRPLCRSDSLCAGLCRSDSLPTTSLLTCTPCSATFTCYRIAHLHPMPCHAHLHNHAHMQYKRPNHTPTTLI